MMNLIRQSVQPGWLALVAVSGMMLPTRAASPCPASAGSRECCSSLGGCCEPRPPIALSDAGPVPAGRSLIGVPVPGPVGTPCTCRSQEQGVPVKTPVRLAPERRAERLVSPVACSCPSGSPVVRLPHGVLAALGDTLRPPLYLLTSRFLC
jgi:hypothetical protein